MFMEPSNCLLGTEYNATAACLCYKFTLRCDEKSDLYDACANHACGLSLVPGAVFGSSSLPCSYPATEIKLPPCQTQAAFRVPVEVQDPCEPLCEDMDQCIDNPNMDSGCASCCIWTSTTKNANQSCAYIGEIITYTIKFTNHSPCTLDMVCISDDLPTDVILVPNSIYPKPKPGETLETGIAVGSIPACSSVTLTYSVKIQSCMCAPSCIINHACVKYCYIDCRGCKRYGVGQCKECAVQVLPAVARISVAKTANKCFVWAACEEISYTLTISNTGNLAVMDITVYDDLPQGLCYQVNSTRRNHCAPSNENPARGIYIGMLSPGETYFVSFVLVVCMPDCCVCQPTEFVNRARASGYSCGRQVCGVSELWIVTMNSTCFCQHVRVCLPICDFANEKGCYIDHRGTTCHKHGDRCSINTRYAICIKYIDCRGAVRNKVFENSVVFNDLPQDIPPEQLTVQYTHLNCCRDFCGNMIAEFYAHLHYCNEM